MHLFWFQSLGAVIGALERGLEPVRDELGLYMCAGRGRHSRKTPDELRVYDETIRALEDAVSRASLGNDERMAALRRLDEQARRLEREADGPSWPDLVRRECRSSPRYGGMTVKGPATGQPNLLGLED